MTIANERLFVPAMEEPLTKPLSSIWLQGQNLLAATHGQKRRLETKPQANKVAEKAIQAKLTPTIELKAIPLSEAKYAAPLELTAEQLKDMQDRTKSTLQTIKQIKEMLASGQNRGVSDKETLATFSNKLKADIDFYSDCTHNHAQPAINDPQLEDSASFEKTVDKHWQSLASESKQASENKEIFSQLLTDTAGASNNDKLELTLNRIEQNISSFAYPLSNLRTSCFTKQEIADYEEVERQRQGIRYWGKTPRELAPYNKQHELLKPYFEMANTYLDSMLLANNPCKQVEFQEKLTQFATMFNDNKIRSLETSDKITPGIRSELQRFAHMASLCKFPVSARHSGDLECMRTPAMEIQGFEFALKSKEHFGANWPTYSCVDDITAKQ
jgi:hypothetical protein